MEKGKFSTFIGRGLAGESVILVLMMWLNIPCSDGENGVSMEETVFGWSKRFVDGEYGVRLK